MNYYTLLVVFLVVLKLCGLTYADCYPGDSQYTAIVQELYRNVTSDRISGLRGYPNSLTRSQLCNLLVSNHNNGYLPESGQPYSNKRHLGRSISVSKCVDALTYTAGYDTDSGWIRWAGFHYGKWWSNDGDKVFDDHGTRWYQPYLHSNQTYAVQNVDYYGREDQCTYRDQTGATCRYGWNQSGKGIHYVWRWDPKENYCPPESSRGRTGAHVGFTFDQGKTSCIIWITSDEAFLECVRNWWWTLKQRSSCNHDGGRYGQWIVF